MNRSFLALFLSVVWLCASSPGTAESVDPDSILAKYGSTIRQIQTPSDLDMAVQTMSGEYGLTKDLMSFITDFSGGAYTTQIETIMNMPVQKWNPNAGPGWGMYEIQNVKTIVTKYESVPVTQRISSGMSTVGKCLTAYSIMQDCLAAYRGDDRAKLSAVAKMTGVTRDWLIGQIGSKSLSVAMFGVEVINYALNSFISYAFSEHETYWWQAYVATMEAKYPHPLEWAQLAEREGMEAVERRLMEFWDNAEINASEYLLDGKRLPPSWGNVTGDLLQRYRKGFAARYYTDYIHTTLKTYFSLKAEQALNEVSAQYTQSAGQVSEIARDMATLKAALESMPEDVEEMEEDGDVEAMMSRIEEISGQVAAGAATIKSSTAPMIPRLESCLGILRGRSGEMEGLRSEATAWKGEMDALLGRDLNLGELTSRAQKLGTTVATARGEAEKQALTACEEALIIKESGGDNLVRVQHIPKLDVAVRLTEFNAKLARQNFKVMKQQLDGVKAWSDELSSLEGKRDEILSRLPADSECLSLDQDSQEVVGTVMAQLEELVSLNQEAVGIAGTVRAYYEQGTQTDATGIKKAFAKIKDKTQGMFRKNKVNQHTEEITAQVELARADGERLQAAVASYQSAVSLMEGQLQGVRNILDDVPQDSAALQGFQDLQALVSATELFVEPAESAAEQAKVCQDAVQGEGDSDEDEDSSEDESVEPEEDSGDDGSAEGWVSVGSTQVIEVNPTDPDGSDPLPDSGGTYDPDTNRWIQKAQSDFASCRFQDALQSANNASTISPDHPWLQANLTVIQTNAQKQQQALSILNGVQNQLSQGNLSVTQLQNIRETLNMAASIAPNCMVDDINRINDNISSQIADARSRDQQQTAAAMGDLLRTFTSAMATVTQTTGGATGGGGYAPGTTSTRPQTGASTDPCESKYHYPSAWSDAPICDCPGYTWKQNKCVSTGGGGGGTVAGSTGSTGSGSSQQQGDVCEISVSGAPPETTYWALFSYRSIYWHAHRYHYVVKAMQPGRTPQSELVSACSDCKPEDMKVIDTGTKEAMRSKANQLCPNPLQVHVY
ncbi:MAG TPA: hypothetical protein PK014_03280 [Thermoanaerobaculia bacterium]|nr:hypothetical protein [Thermoanaerobaculia bacterium]HUM29077.1 hypothetical protein [Thermoanaerobaculia bacterium]HXK67367.1 hypothetical protein [Thermoanaerobaculia bacterium]